MNITSDSKKNEKTTKKCSVLLHVYNSDLINRSTDVLNVEL